MRRERVILVYEQIGPGRLSRRPICATADPAIVEAVERLLGQRLAPPPTNANGGPATGSPPHCHEALNAPHPEE